MVDEVKVYLEDTEMEVGVSGSAALFNERHTQKLKRLEAENEARLEDLLLKKRAFFLNDRNTTKIVAWYDRLQLHGVHTLNSAHSLISPYLSPPFSLLMIDILQVRLNSSHILRIELNPNSVTFLSGRGRYSRETRGNLASDGQGVWKPFSLAVSDSQEVKQISCLFKLEPCQCENLPRIPSSVPFSVLISIRRRT